MPALSRGLLKGKLKGGIFKNWNEWFIDDRFDADHCVLKIASKKILNI